MGETFANKWYSPFGQVLDGDDFGKTFLLWCEKTERLTKTQWMDGFKAVERKMIADAGNNRAIFPPSTPAEFIAMAKSMKPATAGNAAQSQKIHPNLIARDKEEKLQIAQPGYKEKKKKAGNDSLSNIKGMFK